MDTFRTFRSHTWTHLGPLGPHTSRRLHTRASARVQRQHDGQGDSRMSAANEQYTSALARHKQIVQYMYEEQRDEYMYS
jgi:hypothetical protein